jgi:hypothetical protein
MADKKWVALDSSTDRRSWARTLSRAHERGLAGDMAQSAVREVIGQSWRRSTRSRVDPLHGLAPIVISAEEAEARWVGSPLNIAGPLLSDLLEDVGSAGQQVVLVCDQDGVMLWIDGDPRLLSQASDINLERGSCWSEDRAGTNAMGTALAAGHPLQVFSAEHFAVSVHDWTCSAAPVRDPETGRVVGVVDLSGELSTAHPHSLGLVRAAARIIETGIAQAAHAQASNLCDLHASRVGGGPGRAVALTSAAGTVVETAQDRLRGKRLLIPAEGGEVGAELGLSLVAEPVAGSGFLLWQSGEEVLDTRGVRELQVSLLGRDEALVLSGRRSVALSRRHSEILCLLSLVPEGMAAEQLAFELYGNIGKEVTVRAEVSRMRRVLPGLIASNPYRLTAELQTDRSEVEVLVRSGRLVEALELYRGLLLPGSDAPLIAEARQSVDDLIRDAVLDSGSVDLVARWLDNPSGRDDVDACRTLVRALEIGDPRRPVALSRLRRLCQPRP